MTVIDIIRIVLSAILALLFIFTGGGKLVGVSSSHAIRDSINVAPIQWKLIGVFEFIVVALLIVGVWIVSVGIAGAAGVVAVMVGAIITRVRAGGEQLKSGVTADVVFLALGVATLVLGIISL